MYSEQKGIEYEVFYKDDNIQTYQRGTDDQLRKIASGRLDTAGMRELSTEVVEIEKNKNYSIIIKVRYPEDVSSFHVALQEMSDAAQGKYPDLPEGKTFISRENEEDSMYWRGISNGEFYGGSFKGNAYISAYTDIVETEEIAVTDVKTDPESAELLVGEIIQLSATISPENATDKTVHWSSSNEAVAVVDENGTVSAKKKGKARITVLTEDGQKKSESTITVIEENEIPDGVYGTVPWIWEKETQTIVFGGGEFPTSTLNYNLRNQ
ncbi:MULTISPECIES: Ig-like domain-containing protein [unclassified Enterococcus]|nr:MULTISPECIES: Ig-like domain-containing protein [unclassified Enterococcus]